MSMKIWSWTVDDWNAMFQVLTIIFVAGTVLTGVGKIWTDKIIKERQAQELAAARISTTKLETDLAKQQERAAKAEKELLEVQERFKPRTLSRSEQNDLFGLLRAHSSLARRAREKNGEVLWIVHPRGDPEATEFAAMLANLFSQAGWQPQLRDIPFSVHITGIAILVSDPANPPLLAQLVKRVFEEARIPFSVQPQPDSGERTWLAVGSKY